MRAPYIGPDRPQVWPRDLETLNVQPYTPPPRAPSKRELVLVMAEKHGLAAAENTGYVASLRRHLATKMQAPGAKNPSEYYLTPFVVNIPLMTLISLLDEKYWIRKGGSAASSSAASLISGVGVVTFETDSSAAIGKLFELQSTRRFGMNCGKLVMPPKVTAAVEMVIAQPPGQIVHRTREDKSMVIEAHFNFATLNEVLTTIACPTHLSRPAACHPMHCHLTCRVARVRSMALCNAALSMAQKAGAQSPSAAMQTQLKRT